MAAMTESMNRAMTPPGTAAIAPKTPAVSAAKSSSVWLLVVCAVLLPTMVTAPINGFVASTVKYPFVAGLIDETNEINYIPFCTGTILTSRFVLTTYACIRRDTDKGGTFRRRNQIQAKAIVVIYGTAFSPTFTNQSDKLYPNWQLDPDATTTKSEKLFDWLYDARRGLSFIFPNTEDLEEAFHGDENLSEIVEEGNEYFEEKLGAQKFARYRLDFAVIELEKEIKWSEEVLPAIFPFEGDRLARQWWQKRVRDDKNGIEFMEPCHFIGWGGWNGVNETQVRLRYTEVKFVPYRNCELSYCNECSYCNRTWRVQQEHQACYKSIFNGDTCLEDEGGPVWCPWAGTTTQRSGKPFVTGAVLGILSHSTSCTLKTVPGIYSNSWQAYSLISRATRYQFPPSLLVFEDILQDSPANRAAEDEATEAS